MRVYTQLTQEQRYQIYALMKADHSQAEIAEIVGVHKSTVSREVRRNRGLKGYRPQQAHWLAVQRRRDKVQARITIGHWRLIERLLPEDWNPEQISLWLAEERHLAISHEWIYSAYSPGHGPRRRSLSPSALPERTQETLRDL